ncbi:hypothetical protein K438DRAFT_1995213 [Mycena galopus ATCC 62051]|nr:hypothetical protein K438DRAFT_1995213 [Mycena galopus ATCC 62051]
MCTPKLWSKVAVDTSVWDRCTVSVATLFGLLESSLNRGENHPLTLEVSVQQFCPHSQSVLELLCKHAPRWQDVYFCSDIWSSRDLAAAKGNLGRLDTLCLTANWNGVDIFRDAPRLRKVKLYCDVDSVPDLPWAQILTLTYNGDVDVDPFDCISFLRSPKNLLTAFFDLDVQGIPPDLPWKRVSSDVRCLNFYLTANNSVVVGQMFDALTLPCLESFAFCPRDGDSPPLWPPNHFLTLADRSSFAQNLTFLRVHAIITDEELLDCLKALLVLEQLIISDDTLDNAHVVITDTLLQGLVYRSGTTPLVPRLDFLNLTSLLGFTDSTYVDLITSRVKLSDEFDSDKFFGTKLWWAVGRRREVSSEMLDTLLGLAAEG